MYTILTNRQTPCLDRMTSEQTVSFIKDNRDKLESFLNFTVGLNNAAGLASNQCGLKERYCAVMTRSGFKLLINPIITKYTGASKVDEEGCLSWPNKVIIAERHDEITVEYFDIDGNYQEDEVVGWPAKIIQHEVDHLDGVEERIENKDYKTVKRDAPKVGRNDPCVCGSGKKFKKCCG